MGFLVFIRRLLMGILAMEAGMSVGAYQTKEDFDWWFLDQMKYAAGATAALLVITWLLTHKYDRRTRVLINGTPSMQPPK